MRAGLWRDVCYHGGVALVAHDWSYGARFYELSGGQAFTFEGHTYRVTSRQIMTVGEQFGVFNWRVGLVLMTCSGAQRLVIGADRG
jgi:hypothetical protein